MQFQPVVSGSHPNYSANFIRFTFDDGSKVYANTDFDSIDRFQDQLHSGKRGGAFRLVKAAIIPVRTNNLKNICKDVLLPTTVNRALKIHNLAGRIFAVVFALGFDILTLPIRLITLIPRAIHNAKAEKTFLKTFLDHHRIDYKNSERVKVDVRWQRAGEEFLCKYKLQDGTEQEKMRPKVNSSTETINLIDRPYQSGAEKRIKHAAGIDPAAREDSSLPPMREVAPGCWQRG